MDFATDPLALSPALKDFLAGAVAGAFAITVSQPLDTVRVRLQQAVHGSGPGRDALSVLATMIRREGVLSPFKGLTYPLLFASVQSAILFQAYGWTLRHLSSPQGQEQRQSQPELSAPSPSLAAPRPQPGAGTPTTSNTTASASSSLHQLHLHHHHHHQEHHAAAVHGSGSVSGQVLAWVAARLAGTGAAAGAAPSAPSSAVAAQSAGGIVTGAAAAAGAASSSICSSPLGRHVACEHIGSGAGGDRSGCSSSSSSRSNGCSSGDVEDGAGRCSSGAEAGIGRCEESCGTAERSDAVQGRQQQQQQLGHGGQQAALPTPWHGFLAGSVSGFAQVFLWSPVELLKLRAQLQTAIPGSAGYRNPVALAKQVIRQDGVVGMYRGFTLTVVRDVPSYAFYFWLYHDIAGALSPGVHPEQAPPTTQVLAGGLAGVIAWLPIYPLDVLKTRVQAVGSSASRGKTWLHFAREMYQEAGARAFFRGVAPTLLRAFVMDGASFLGYTTTLKTLGGGGGGGGGGREAVAAVPAPAPA